MWHSASCYSVTIISKFVITATISLLAQLGSHVVFAIELLPVLQLQTPRVKFQSKPQYGLVYSEKAMQIYAYN